MIKTLQKSTGFAPWSILCSYSYMFVLYSLHLSIRSCELSLLGPIKFCTKATSSRPIWPFQVSKSFDTLLSLYPVDYFAVYGTVRRVIFIDILSKSRCSCSLVSLLLLCNRQAVISSNSTWLYQSSSSDRSSAFLTPTLCQTFRRGLISLASIKCWHVSSKRLLRRTNPVHANRSFHIFLFVSLSISSIDHLSNPIWW